MTEPTAEAEELDLIPGAYRYPRQVESGGLYHAYRWRDRRFLGPAELRAHTQFPKCYGTECDIYWQGPLQQDD